MALRARLIRWLRRGIAPAAVLLLLLVALYLAADAEGLGTRYARYYPHVFVAASLALLLLAAAIAARLLRLLRQLRQGAPGARLTRRLVLLLVLLAVPPVLLVYGFGARFVLATVDSWFEVNTEAVLGDALAIAQLYLAEREAAARAATDRLAGALSAQAGAALDVELDAALEQSGAGQLAVYGRDGRLLALAAATPGAFASDAPADGIRLEALARGHYAAAEPAGDGLRLRVLSLLPDGQRLLQALYPLPAGYGALARAVEAGVHQHRRAAFLRESLKLAFVLVLSFVLLLSLLLALLLAFDLTRRLVAPIARLSQATRQVAAGDYGHEVPGATRDELGFLVESFNTMTRELAASSARERASAAETEAQRAYLETVLVRLSSGVVSLGADGMLRTANPAADVILGGAVGPCLARPVAALAERAPELAPLAAALARRLGEGAREWREEVLLERGPGQRQLLLLRGAALPDGGLVAVFDDTTGLDRARRDAAWAEVARRLAHEVKNPLTPIQLAAERLRRRVLPQLAPGEAEVLDRASATIVAQVEALKSMVNAFSEYARPPALALRPLALGQLADEVLALYEHGPARVRRRFDPALPSVTADADRLRQVLHNLLKNAIEATPAGQAPEIDVATALVEDGGRRFAELSIADRGQGLPADFDAAWFEPYRSTKPRGTGLGLAIVRKIAEEHGGQLLASAREGGGARFALRLPL